MRFLTNEDVSSLLDGRIVLEALRTGYAEYRAGLAAQIPRADLIAPATTGTYRLGVMAGISRAFDIGVVRIKSDVVNWQADREEKHSIEAGLFSGTVVAFRVSDGAPMAIVQDGVLQHLRVAAAAALGTEMLCPRSMKAMAILGSGGMARAVSEMLGHLGLVPASIRLYSPNPAHRDSFAVELEARHPSTRVERANDPEHAVRGAGLILTATNSTAPTVDPEWLKSGAHVTAVSRREVGVALREAADFLACLGPTSYPAESVPGMTRTRGGYGAFMAMTAAERERLPEVQRSDVDDEHHLMIEGVPWAQRPEGYRTVLTAVGTQGVQFAAVVGALVAAADRAGVGKEIPDELFLHDVRN